MLVLDSLLLCLMDHFHMNFVDDDDDAASEPEPSIQY